MQSAWSLKPIDTTGFLPCWCTARPLLQLSSVPACSWGILPSASEMHTQSDSGQVNSLASAECSTSLPFLPIIVVQVDLSVGGWSRMHRLSRCFWLTNPVFLFLRHMSGLHCVVNPLYLFWEVFSWLDFDTPTSWSVFSILQSSITIVFHNSHVFSTHSTVCSDWIVAQMGRGTPVPIKVSGVCIRVYILVVVWEVLLSVLLFFFLHIIFKACRWIIASLNYTVSFSLRFHWCLIITQFLWAVSFLEYSNGEFKVNYSSSCF